MAVPMSVWAADILAALGAPHTQGNVNNLAAWQACEGNPGLGANNPFNDTQPWTGSRPLVPVPGTNLSVQGYPDYHAGLGATLYTLRSPFARPIVDALRADASRPVFAAAVGQSGWGTNPQCIATSSAAGGLAGGTGSTGTGGPAGAGSRAGAGCLPAASIILLPAACAAGIGLAELAARLIGLA